MTTRLRTLDDYKAAYKKSVEAPEAFWAEQAETFVWHKKWDKVLDWDFKGPDVKWFDGGKLNITENCLDRHLETRANKTAILWVPNDPNAPAKEITYKELYEEVNVVANGLKAKGIGKGDRVIFYMPMIPELAIGVLACARIGAAIDCTSLSRPAAESGNLGWGVATLAASVERVLGPQPLLH